MNYGFHENGNSPSYTKRMALEAREAAVGGQLIEVAVDIGCGAGDFTRQLVPFCRRLIALDYYLLKEPIAGVSFHAADLNGNWPIPDESVDFGFALEVIEHLENPRHFMREFTRILKRGAFGFLSTPNNHSLASHLTFLIKGEHRRFQAASYPAHLTALLRCDMERILRECKLHPVSWYYSNCDTIPRLHWEIRLPGRLFSDSVGCLFRKR